MKEKIKYNFKNLYDTIQRPEMAILPGHLAFYFLMMLIPFLALIGSLLTTIDITSKTVTDIIYENLPDVVADVVISISKQDTAAVSLWVLLIPTLILASNGTYSVITVANSIYKVKDENMVKSYIINKIKSFLMLFVLITIFIFLLLIPTFGNIIFKIIGQVITNEKIINNVYYIMFNILKYPVTFLLVYISIKILYLLAPNIKVKENKVRYGAVIASVLLVVSTIGYSIYIENFSTYETFYGGISSLLILMLWIYVVSYVFTLGMALNVTHYKIREKQDIAV